MMRRGERMRLTARGRLSRIGAAGSVGRIRPAAAAGQRANRQVGQGGPGRQAVAQFR